VSAHDYATGKLGPSAAWYANQGWKILPCHGITLDGRCTCNSPHPEPKDKGKHPAINGWNSAATSDAEKLAQYWEQNPEFNVGVYCRPSGFFVIDIDPRGGGSESFEKFEALVEGALPPTVEATTGEYTIGGGRILRGRHLFYKCDESEDLIGNLSKAGLKGIDIKHNGYVLIAPSRHFSGQCYEWVQGKRPDEIEMAQAPEELLKFLRKRGSSRGSTSIGTGDWETIFDDLEFSGRKVDIEKILEEGNRAVGLYELACALANKFPVETEAGRLAVESLMIRFNAEKVRPPMPLEGTNSVMMHTRRAIEFVRKNPKINRLYPGLSEWAQERQNESRATTQPRDNSEQSPSPMLGVVQPPQEYQPTTSLRGQAIMDAIHDGKSISQAFSSTNLNIPKDIDAVSAEDGGSEFQRSLSDIGNGRRLVDTFKDVIRYTEGLGWFHWNNGYWTPDPEELDVRELAKRIPPMIASETVYYADDANKQNEIVKWAAQSKSLARIRSAIDTANSDPRILVPVEHWDRDENLLGVKNGVVDLRTGELLQNRPDLFITRRAPVGYIRGQKNTRWEQFLDYATGGDKELQDWLQRAAGYSLTGSRKYDIMFLVYGPPGSGKNTFVEALVKCLGTKQYAWPLDSSILAQNDGKASGQDLYHWAELRGRRVVWVDELPDSERMKENSVKRLTGSSEISARSPGEKPFTFESKAKLWVSTNHRPIITDDAMWRRIRPVPFIHVPENPDPDLKEYIFDPEGALTAVLSWAVEGAIKLLGSSSRDGLGWCRAVSEAAEIYRKNEDRIGLFLSEETNENEGHSVSVKDLYTTYRIWSEDRGERPMTQVAFDRKLRDRNLPVVGSGSRAIVNGRSQVPRIVPSGEVDWGAASRIARL
jgi:P4 family phage/plasmid primase-like protien